MILERDNYGKVKSSTLSYGLKIYQSRLKDGSELNSANSSVNTAFSSDDNTVTSKLSLSNLGQTDVGKYQCSYISPIDKNKKTSKEITLHLYGEKNILIGHFSG